MTQTLAPRDGAAIIEQVIAKGDLAQLTPPERVSYYREVCRSLGLNELTRPFEYIVLNGKLTLYARKDCTEQLRKIHGVSITRLDREAVGDLYVVTAYAKTANGRLDSDIGATSIIGLRGEALVNAMLKATTKAKRRVTLSICGLGITDESELESIASVQPVEDGSLDVIDVPARQTEDDDSHVCEVCKQPILTPDGQPINDTQAGAIHERYDRLLCREHRPVKAAAV